MSRRANGPVAVFAQAIGAVAIASQLFRNDPNTIIFGGGVLLVVLGLIAFSDNRAAERGES